MIELRGAHEPAAGAFNPFGGKEVLQQSPKMRRASGRFALEPDDFDQHPNSLRRASSLAWQSKKILDASSSSSVRNPPLSIFSRRYPWATNRLQSSTYCGGGVNVLLRATVTRILGLQMSSLTLRATAPAMISVRLLFRASAAASAASLIFSVRYVTVRMVLTPVFLGRVTRRVFPGGLGGTPALGMSAEGAFDDVFMSSLVGCSCAQAFFFLCTSNVCDSVAWYGSVSRSFAGVVGAFVRGFLPAMQFGGSRTFRGRWSPRKPQYNGLTELPRLTLLRVKPASPFGWAHTVNGHVPFAMEPGCRWKRLPKFSTAQAVSRPSRRSG